MNHGIYLHIPFCEQKCGYCDFYSATNFNEFSDLFIESLLLEIESRADNNKLVDSIFFGGGTPSMLSPKQIEKIYNKLFRSFKILPGCEITIESNPNSVDINYFTQLKDLGINRVSFGIQSFIDSELAKVERIHSSKDAIQSYIDCREAGFLNISIDLIFALPGQSINNWKYNLDRLIELKPDHISAYNLILEQNTKFGQLASKGLIKKQSDNNERKFYELTINFLEEHGYKQYEISNFSSSEHTRSRHNFKYWNFEPYIGFGPSAHSYDGLNLRWWNIRSTEKYIDMLRKNLSPVSNQEELDRNKQLFESVMLGFRLNEGINLSRFYNRFNINFEELFKDSIDKYKKMGLLEINQNYCYLTNEGRFYCDAIACDFEVN